MATQDSYVTEIVSRCIRGDQFQNIVVRKHQWEPLDAERKRLLALGLTSVELGTRHCMSSVPCNQRLPVPLPIRRGLLGLFLAEKAEWINRAELFFWDLTRNRICEIGGYTTRLLQLDLNDQ